MKWKQLPGSPAATGQITSGGYPTIDSACDCASKAGDTGNCSIATGSGYSYYSCICQQ
jgi:hypothetical protein